VERFISGGAGKNPGGPNLFNLFVVKFERAVKKSFFTRPGLKQDAVSQQFSQLPLNYGGKK